VPPTLATPLPQERTKPAQPKIQRREVPAQLKDDSLEIFIDEDADLDELAKRIEKGAR
jgi:hypothetical protein